MAPKRGRKRWFVGTVTRSTRRVVRETVSVVVEGDTQESTQEEQNGETEELVDKEPAVRVVPVEEKVQEEETELVEVPLGGPKRDIPVHDAAREEAQDKKEGEMAGKGGEEEEAEERRAEEREDKEEERSGVEQEEQGGGENRQGDEKRDTCRDSAREEAQQGRKSVIGKKERKPQEGKGGNVSGRKRKRKGKGREEEGHGGYKRYVFKVLKQVHPELRISSVAMSVINSFMKDIFERLADEAAKLSRYADRTTLSYKEIQDAVKLVLPGELGKHAIAEGSKAITNYASFDGKKPKSRS